MSINTKLFSPRDNATWASDLMVVPVRCEGNLWNPLGQDEIIVLSASTYKQARAKAALNPTIVGCTGKHTPLVLGKKED